VLFSPAPALSGGLAAPAALCRPRPAPAGPGVTAAPVQLVTWVPPIVRLRSARPVPAVAVPALAARVHERGPLGQRAARAACLIEANSVVLRNYLHFRCP